MIKHLLQKLFAKKEDGISRRRRDPIFIMAEHLCEDCKWHITPAGQPAETLCSQHRNEDTDLPKNCADARIFDCKGMDWSSKHVSSVKLDAP